MKTIFLLLMMSAACSPAPTEAVQEPTAVVEAAAPGTTVDAELATVIDLARSIRTDPTNAATHLTNAGMTEDEFTAKLWDIAEDPEQSAAYSAALAE
jgi:hypothetical protein